jgi:hypothetical protein
MSKFSPKNLQAVIVRLIKEPFLIEKFYDSLHPEDFILGQQDIRKQALGRMIEVLLTYYKENSLDNLNLGSFQARLNSYADSEVNDETRRQFSEMLQDDELMEISANDGILEVFMEIMQRNMTLRWFSDFKRQFSNNDMKNAITHGREFFEKLEQVKIKDEGDFDYREVDTLFDSTKFDPTLCLATGLPELDLELCGGLEPATLTVFVAPPAGGKGQACSHIIQNCIKQKKYVHVTIVEDRKKTFLPRVLSGISEISVKRLKTEFNQLTPQELLRFNKAVQLMKKYVKLDFLYDSTVSEIHQRKLQWIKYCKLHGLPVPQVDILDYSGHVAVTAAGDKTHEKYLMAYAVRKNYALKHNMIGIDFAQVNRDGSKKMTGDDIITKNDLASSFDLSRVCDNIVTINRNDDQKAKNKAIFYMAKVRDAGAIDGNKFEVETDYDYGRYLLGNAINLSRISTSIMGAKK